MPFPTIRAKPHTYFYASEVPLCRERYASEADYWQASIDWALGAGMTDFEMYSGRHGLDFEKGQPIDLEDFPFALHL